MQMRAGWAAGRADLADDLAGLLGIADLAVHAGKVAVAGREAVAVVDVDHLAVAALPAGDGHGTVGGGAHRIAGLPGHVEPGVHRGRAQERIDAHAEARGGVDVARHRLADRHIAERTRQPVELGTGKADAVDVPLEAAGVWTGRGATNGPPVASPTGAALPASTPSSLNTPRMRLALAS